MLGLTDYENFQRFFFSNATAGTEKNSINCQLVPQILLMFLALKYMSVAASTTYKTQVCKFRLKDYTLSIPHILSDRHLGLAYCVLMGKYLHIFCQ